MSMSSPDPKNPKAKSESASNQGDANSTNLPLRPESPATEWKIYVKGIGENGPILMSIMSPFLEGAPDDAERLDQRYAPPLDADLLQRYANGETSDKETRRIEKLTTQYLSWEFLCCALTAEGYESQMRNSEPPIMKIDFDKAKMFVRQELPEGEAQAIERAIRLLPGWAEAVAAAEVELVCRRPQV